MSTTTTTFASPKKTISSPFIASAPQRKTMSITQTYFLAHKARAKLSSEAARPDHNLRLLVGHANLLDTLMLELADAEREQESWFNQSVRGASPQQPKADRHVQWADTVVEEPEEDWQAEDADDDSDASSDASDDYSDSDEESDSESSIDEDEDVEMADAIPLRRVDSHTKPTMIEQVEEEEEEDDAEEDDEEDYAHLTLTRSPSHSANPPLSPPELMEDSDVSSDDESAMPPSPPVVTIPTFSKKGSKAAPAAPQQEDEAFDDNTNNYYLPPRNPARLISAISVY